MNAGKDYLKDKKRNKEIRKCMEDYIEKQSNINELCELAEEIDFESFTNYISKNLLGDIKEYLFENKSNRKRMKEDIVSKAYAYSGATSEIQKERVRKIINDSLDILYDFYKRQIPDPIKFVSVDIIENLDKKLDDKLENQTVEIVNKIKSMKQEKIEKGENTEEIAKKNTKIENSKFLELHNFILKNYIKKKYRDEELSEQDIEKYSDLFKLSITILDRKKEIRIKDNIFKFIKDDILTQKEGNLIKISGPDGTGKSTFLSILYIYLYKYCVENGFSFYPYYINLHFYDNIINEDSPEEIIKETMYKDLRKLTELVEIYPNIPYIIIIDGNENYFRTTLKSGKYFDLFIKDIYAHKKIVCIGEKTNVHIYRERKQYRYIYERMQYLFKFKSISRYDKEKWKKFVDIYCSIEKREGLSEQINRYLESFDLDEVDLNILNVFKECYDNDILGEVNSLSDLYKNYCMAYLKDADDFEDCAKMSYEYFMTNRKFTQNQIANNSSKWNLIHQHKTISNFLIAYYYVRKVKAFCEREDTQDLEYLFSMDVNIFIKPLINDNHETQKLIFDRCKRIYQKGGILAKSQALYMMGRITYKNLRPDILLCLEGYYDVLYGKFIERELNQTEQEDRNSHLLLRSVIISLVYLGKKDKREAYLKMLLNYPVANEINRGFHLEYYGDVPRKPDSRLYNYNDDGSGEIDITYNILLDRVQHYLLSDKGTEDLNFQINLFTLCSLIQVRLGKEGLSEVRKKKLKKIIDETLKREQSNLNIDFKAYLTMLKEDIEKKTYAPYFLYEKLYGIKDIVRKGWEEEIKNEKIQRPYENVAEHIYYTWMLGMLYLPEEPPKETEYEYYDKKKILNAVLIHDWAEIDVGDEVPKKDTEARRDLENFRMRVILMHDTYDQIGNMSQYKKIWNVYKKDSSDINGKIAFELDKIQALYQFYTYQSKGAEFTKEKIEDWKNEKNKITTSLGKKILKEVVLAKFERQQLDGRKKKR